MAQQGVRTRAKLEIVWAATLGTQRVVTGVLACRYSLLHVAGRRCSTEPLVSSHVAEQLQTTRPMHELGAAAAQHPNQEHFGERTLARTVICI